MAILTQDQFARFSDALGAAFDNFSLNVLVTKRINKLGLGHYVTPFAPMDYQATVLAQRAESDDFTASLIRSARESRPHNEIFASLAHELGLTSLGARTPEYLNLEVEVRKTNRFHDLAIWRTRLTDIESRVCAIDIRGTLEGQEAVGHGTGFLVGADRVLTNWHVVRCLLDKTPTAFEARPENVTLRFDYKRLNEKVLHPGDEFRLADPWQIALSPEDDLDYALIALAQKAGEKPVAGWTGITEPPLRGWFELAPTDEPYAPGTPILIAQHPEGKPLQFAFDTDSIIGLNEERTRLRHRTNTLPGSSGSPCFNAALDLIGIHRSGDGKKEAAYNVGIPINAVIERLKATSA